MCVVAWRGGYSKDPVTGAAAEDVPTTLELLDTLFGGPESML